jgi:hypothetical protein
VYQSSRQDEYRYELAQFTSYVNAWSACLRRMEVGDCFSSLYAISCLKDPYTAMSSALLLQGDFLSIITIPKPLAEQATPLAAQRLSLPTRFPPASPVLTTVSKNGNVYLYSPAAIYVWEYDSKGRGTSEMSFVGLGNVWDVTVLNDVSGSIAVVLQNEDDVRLMRKNSGGKWELRKTLKVRYTHFLESPSAKPLSKGPGGRITAITSDNDGSVMTIGTERGLLSVCVIEGDTTTLHDVSSHVMVGLASGSHDACVADYTEYPQNNIFRAKSSFNGTHSFTRYILLTTSEHCHIKGFDNTTLP